MTEEYTIVSGGTLVDYIGQLTAALSMLRIPHVEVGVAQDPNQTDPQWTLLLELNNIGVDHGSNLRNWLFSGEVLQWGSISHLHARHQFTGEFNLDTGKGVLRFRTVAASNVPMCIQCGIPMNRAGSCFACPSCGDTSGCS